MNMSRIENYNEEQKLYLLYCIRGVVDTVEDARKDTVTTLRRRSVWDDLSNTLNSRFSSRRPSSPAAHLKNLWKRLKVEARKAIAERTHDQDLGSVCREISPFFVSLNIRSSVRSLIFLHTNNLFFVEF